MKLLCLCSALDLDLGYGCTPAWWQLFKALAEEGHELVVVPYQGPAVSTPWWRTYPNPCEIEGKAFRFLKGVVGQGATATEGGMCSQAMKHAIDGWVRPRWERRVGEIFVAEHGIDAVVVFTIPMNHFTGLAGHIRERFSATVVYYDGDVPASLPEFGGYASGFRIYDGAEPGEYDAVICNSEGGRESLSGMGARQVHTLHWAADPHLFAPLDVEQDRDVFFYGYGAEYRESWIENMITAPSRILSEASFAVGGSGFSGRVGAASEVGVVPASGLRRACCRSRINLGITRKAHASVFASSSTRLFELAAMGCCVVSNPYDGIETWFEVGKEVAVVHSAEEAVETYRRLLGDEEARRAMGDAARRAVLERHTYAHRARELVGILEALQGAQREE